MPKYSIIETTQAISVCVYEVEADSQDIAIEMVESGKLIPTDTWVDEDEGTKGIEKIDLIK